MEYILWLENIILQTVGEDSASRLTTYLSFTGFNLELMVPHPIVMSMAKIHKPEDKKLSESVFWLVTDVLHLTNWSLMHRANRIAVVCFYMALIWKKNEERVCCLSSFFLYSHCDYSLNFHKRLTERLSGLQNGIA